MKKLLLLLFIIPLISISQSNDFLTKLFLDRDQVQNQNFTLILAGVASPSVDENFKLTEVLWISEINAATQNKSKIFVGGYNESHPLKLKNDCSWNWTKSNPNLNMITTLNRSNLDYFPTFSFLKGKLLTIIDGDNTNKDYLFSVSKSDKYNNYGHKSMSFNLTDDNEKGYTIRTIIFENKDFEERVYIILTYNEMDLLGFQAKFTNRVKFKLVCDDDEFSQPQYYKYSSTYRYLKNPKKSDQRYSSELQNCNCVCDNNYITFFKKKKSLMVDNHVLNQEDLYYLFELVEKSNAY